MQQFSSRLSLSFLRSTSALELCLQSGEGEQQQLVQNSSSEGHLLQVINAAEDTSGDCGLVGGPDLAATASAVAHQDQDPRFGGPRLPTHILFIILFGRRDDEV